MKSIIKSVSRYFLFTRIMLLCFGIVIILVVYKYFQMKEIGNVYYRIGNEFSKMLEEGYLAKGNNIITVNSSDEIYKKLESIFSSVGQINKTLSEPVSLDEIEYFFNRSSFDIDGLDRAIRKAKDSMYESYLYVNKGFTFIFTISVLIALAISGIRLFFEMKAKRVFVSYNDYVKNMSEKVLGLIKLNAPSQNIPIRWLEEKELYDNVSSIEKELGLEKRIISLPVYGTLEDLVPQLMPFLKEYIQCDRVGVAFIDSVENVVAETAASYTENLKLGAGFIQNINDTSLKWIVENRSPRIINDLEYYYKNFHKSRATELILQEGYRSSLTVPIITNDKVVGFLFVNSVNKDAYTNECSQIMLRVMNILKGTTFYSYITQQIVSTSAQAFVSLVEKKDNETGFHISRVSQYSYTIANQMYKIFPTITPKFRREILWFASLHDIGKIGIPDNILLKPGKLTPEEFDIMKQHVLFGENILKDMDGKIQNMTGFSFMKTAIDVAGGHHEKWDGSGYPRKLSGHDIPLAGRIVALADVFDALTSARPYKKAFDFDLSVRMIIEQSGSHFDPDVVHAFTTGLDSIRRIYDRYRE